MKTFFIQNFGCRATQADGAALEGLLGGAGLQPAGARQQADLVILNTCSVTASADEDVRKSIHRVHRENPHARILVTGCYAQRAPEELAEIPGVTWVVGNSHKTLIPEVVAAPYHGQILVGDIAKATEFLSAPVEDAFGDRTRPNLKIQEGCNNLCSFCIIPALRGRSRSMPADEVVGRVRFLAQKYSEVVLTGINLGRWGREAGFSPAGGERLAGLLRRLLDETPVGLLRLSSVEPMDLSDDLLRLMADEGRIARHIHAPLQSGSDTVLRRMKRRYRRRHYEDRILRAHALMPDAAFGADVMTGFPGETDAEFRETFDFVRQLPLTYLHVFTYSERPGTPAAAAADPVTERVRKERTRVLRELGAMKNLEFRKRMEGRVLKAVTLENGTALTTNYIKVSLATPRPANRLIELVMGPPRGDGIAEASPFPVLSF
ncbi:MAG: tRNA (N(6)-L-threonylcarbamoyladenosine(37)-C(2))-methylthiotransferase MtaB [Bryobacteraceae bacterium]|nr:tRNA (N(6)-L-threonylcarbamoyladenosine(37)-C(2))-methylthiotransferase MtaB [Bryobacteraceae bacterium]